MPWDRTSDTRIFGIVFDESNPFGLKQFSWKICFCRDIREIIVSRLHYAESNILVATKSNTRISWETRNYMSIFFERKDIFWKFKIDWHCAEFWLSKFFCLCRPLLDFKKILNIKNYMWIISTWSNILCKLF